MTVIEATAPKTVAKTYSAAPDGTLQKQAIANITEGTGRTICLPDAETMVGVLEDVTSSQNLVLCTGIMHGAGATPYRVVPEAVLARRLNEAIGSDALGGVHIHDGEAIAARLKRGMDPTPWLLLEMDNPPGTPDDWKPLDLGERLTMLEAVVPGISRCERIELRGSSARVHNGSYGPAAHSHAWLRVSDPGKIDVLKQFVHVHAALQGLSFRSPRYQRANPGKIVGYAQRTLIDLSVWDRGRLVFVARPDVQAAGYQAADAAIRVVNAGNGPLDIGEVVLPDDDALQDFSERTGTSLEIRKDRAELRIISTGELTWETEIDRRGVTKTLRAWVSQMSPGTKLRCETPFRASQSEAAVLRLGKGRRPVLHDVGSGITYHLPTESVTPTDQAPESTAFAMQDAADLTEDSAGLAFEKQHRDVLRYCHDTGAWFIFTGTHWAQNRDGLAFNWARDLVRRLNRNADQKGKAITGKAAFAGAVGRASPTRPSPMSERSSTTRHSPLSVPSTRMMMRWKIRCAGSKQTRCSA